MTFFGVLAAMVVGDLILVDVARREFYRHLHRTSAEPTPDHTKRRVRRAAPFRHLGER